MREYLMNGSIKAMNVLDDVLPRRKHINRRRVHIQKK